LTHGAEAICHLPSPFPFSLSLLHFPLTLTNNAPESRYQGYNKDLIDRFVNMGFDVDAVVDAFSFVGIDRNGGEDYELEEAYMGDITARLLGEQ
jgi:ubiquitin-conjugating enzyme (huntingtin interacting protein 2)